MSNTTQDLVEAIINKDAMKIDSIFKAIMTEKMTIKLDEKKKQMACEMFLEKIELAEDEIQLTQEDIDSLLEKHQGLDKLEEALKDKGAKNPAALAAWMDRKKSKKDSDEDKETKGKSEEK